MVNIKKPLTDREAERLKTALEQKGSFLKLRELRLFSPETIARRFNLDAEAVAKDAGRQDDNSAEEA